MMLNVGVAVARLKTFSEFLCVSIMASSALLYTTPVSAQPQAGDAGPQIYAAEAPGVVHIHAVGVGPDGSMDGDDGTGFVVSQRGYVLTASHVIPESTKYTTLLLGGTFGPNTAGAKIYALELVKRSETYDAALVRIIAPPPKLTVLPLRGSPAKVGELLFVLGYPLGLPDTHFLDGRVGSVMDDAITTNALIDRGDSGGPVIDLHGCVIGLVYGAITSREGQPVYGLKFAVPIRSVLSLFPADAGSPSKIQQPGSGADVIHVSDTLSRLQTDHAPLADTTRSYHDVIPSRDGFVIDEIEGVGRESLNPPQLQFPTPVIATDRKSMSFDYTLVSGPIFDQRRGWIDMTIGTRQRRIGNPLNPMTYSCD